MFDFFRRRMLGRTGARAHPTLASNAAAFGMDGIEPETALPLGGRDPFARSPVGDDVPGSDGSTIPVGSTLLPNPPAPPLRRSVVPRADEISPDFRSTVGDDSRTQLIPDYEDLWYTEPDGTRKSIAVPVAPWSAICCLKLHFGQNVFRGTGWFTGPRTIITAAHNLYDREHQSTVDKIVVLAGKIGRGSGPFGEVPTRLFAFDKRYKLQDERTAAPFDYGAVFLADGWLGSFVRNYFKFAAVNPASDIGEIQVAGYPGDGGDRLLYAKGHMQPPGQDSRMIVHDVDTERGQSGAPIYHYHQTTGYTVVGIHTDGFGLFPKRNAGVRITPELKSRLRAWNDHPGARLDENIHTS